jgi:hypothetical protein
MSDNLAPTPRKELSKNNLLGFDLIFGVLTPLSAIKFARGIRCVCSKYVGDEIYWYI